MCAEAAAARGLPEAALEQAVKVGKILEAAAVGNVRDLAGSCTALRRTRPPLHRAGDTMRCFLTSTVVYSETNADHKIWLACGVDLAGNIYENA